MSDSPPTVFDPAAGVPIRRRRSAGPSTARATASPAPVPPPSSRATSPSSGAASPSSSPTGSPSSRAPRGTRVSAHAAAQTAARPATRTGSAGSPAAATIQPVGRRRRSRALALQGDTLSAEPAEAPPAAVGVAALRVRQRAPHRGFGALAQLSVALLCWLGLGLVVYARSPDDPLSRAGFFVLLFFGLAFTVMPLLRALAMRLSHSRIFQEHSGVIAARQAFMVAGFVVLNALLQMMRAWTGLIALLLLGMFAVIEVVALARR